MNIEYALRDKLIPPKDRADLGLRAINTLEKNAHTANLWDDADDNPIPVDAIAYDKERKEAEERIKRIMDRSKTRLKALKTPGEAG